MQRYIENQIQEDLKEKMVFVGGPRQVGKTTLALALLGASNEQHPAYFNWDSIPARRHLLAGELPSGEPLIVLDEIHKYKAWRNLVKGFYDTAKSQCRFLVTGSARLDHYRRGGDSLQGRYHYHRLHPLSLMEISKNPTVADIEHLLEFGGFPEPFLKGTRRHWQRWQNEHTSRVIREDVFSLERVREISQIELLATVLPERVGSPLSVNNLRQDLSVAFETADRWITTLENLYYCFRISPFGVPALRAVQKERKLYLWDWSLCSDAAARFENLVAANLLKYCHYREDSFGEKMSLHFLRDSVGREIDFVVALDRKPLFAIECKTGEKSSSSNIAYFAQRTKIPQFYQVHLGKKDAEIAEHRCRILPFSTLAQILEI